MFCVKEQADDARPDHCRRQRITSARRQGEMLDAQIFGVTLLEPVALVPDSIAEQRLRTDHPRDRVDLFLAGDIHFGFSPSFIEFGAPDLEQPIHLRRRPCQGVELTCFLA